VHASVAAERCMVVPGLFEGRERSSMGVEARLAEELKFRVVKWWRKFSSKYHLEQKETDTVDGSRD
jgi:hypothetical protein